MPDRRGRLLRGLSLRGVHRGRHARGWRDADGTLLVSNFASGQVEAVDVATVAGAPGAAG